ncbi:MAG: hypothetical protein R2727_08140 [Bacteroidales bacterium]
MPIPSGTKLLPRQLLAIAYDRWYYNFRNRRPGFKTGSHKHGVVVDFEMNKVCAAGTGSFLEEQAEKLKINIREEFGNLGLNKFPEPVPPDRCTVSMESDLNSHQQKVGRPG